MNKFHKWNSKYARAERALEDWSSLDGKGVWVEEEGSMVWTKLAELEKGTVTLLTLGVTFELSKGLKWLKTHARWLEQVEEKKVSANKRGKINEKRTHEWLESRGFVVHTVRQAQFGKGGNDLFGLWDHVGIAMPTVGKYSDSFDLEKVFELYNGKWLLVSYGFASYTTVWVQTKTNCKPTNSNAKEHRKFPGIKLWFNWVTGQEQPEIYRLTEVEK